MLLENLLRTEDGANVTADQIRALASWDAGSEPTEEIQFTPARVIMQDFTGVPCVVDLATMREAFTAMGGDPSRINPLAPAELVIDHSVIADYFGTAQALQLNVQLEYERNRERYQFLRWGQSAFDEFRVVPPGTGIVHQVNIEHLARVVMVRDGKAYPDTCVGTDSHTTMVNGLGVLGWGVGGIEAEAAMLGQPVSMLIPRVVGFKLTGQLPAGATATDLVLTITEMLREHGVVGKFVEFYGDGVAAVPLANRATIGNMSPEYGSTVAIFPIDDETLRYLRMTGRPQEQIDLVRAYAQAQGLWHDPQHEPMYSEYLELDLADVVPSLAGPKRPQDRVALDGAASSFREALPAYTDDEQATATATLEGQEVTIGHGAVVIAAITSCTNTSNPSVMIGAALLAKKAVEAGLTRKPWVKTTLAPGSQVVTDYYEKSGLLPYLEKLGFNIVGYGCTTCIGNSGPLPSALSEAIQFADLAAVSVLSGNRNFEGRINPDVKMNYLASPPLVVAYALSGRMDVDIVNEPLGTGADGRPVYLRDLWPTDAEVEAVIADAIDDDMYARRYADVFAGDQTWQNLPTPTGSVFAWDPDSTYVRKPPYFDAMQAVPAPVSDVHGARVLAKLGDSVTTDHISPAGAIKADSPAGRYLAEHGVSPREFNSYGSRRGNHEVMIRGTFANIRLRNQLVPGVEEELHGLTSPSPDSPQTTIYDAAQAYAARGPPGGYWPARSTAPARHGTGRRRALRCSASGSLSRSRSSGSTGPTSSGWVFCHCSTRSGRRADRLGLTGAEVFDVEGVTALNARPSRRRSCPGDAPRGEPCEFDAVVRIDTPGEADYYRNGGILQYVLRSLLDG